MDKMPLLAVLLVSVPESFLFITFGLILMAVKLNHRKTIMISFISAGISYLARLLPFSIGVHTFIGLIAISLLIILIYKVSVKKGIIAALAGLTGLVITDTIATPIMLELTGLTVQEALKDNFLRIVLPLPGILLLALMVILSAKFKITLARR